VFSSLGWQREANAFNEDSTDQERERGKGQRQEERRRYGRCSCVPFPHRHALAAASRQTQLTCPAHASLSLSNTRLPCSLFLLVLLFNGGWIAGRNRQPRRPSRRRMSFRLDCRRENRSSQQWRAVLVVLVFLHMSCRREKMNEEES